MGGSPPPTIVQAPPPQRVGPTFEEQLALQKQAQEEARKLAQEQATLARQTEQLAYERAQKTVGEIGQLTGKTVQQITTGAQQEYETKIPAITKEYSQRLAQYDPSAQLAGYTEAAQRGIRGATEDVTKQLQQATTGFGDIFATGTQLAGEKLKEFSTLGQSQQAAAFLGGAQAQQMAGAQTSAQQQAALQRASDLQRQMFGTFQTAAQRAGRQGQRQMMAMSRQISNLYNPDYLRIATKPPTQRSTLLEETMAKQLYNV